MLDHIMTVRQLIKYAGYELQFEVAAGHDGLDRALKTAESNRPGLALCGHYDHFGHERVQILGQGEISYIESLSFFGANGSFTEILLVCSAVRGCYRWLTSPVRTRRYRQSDKYTNLDDPAIICHLYN